jgi:hypothetical protein
MVFLMILIVEYLFPVSMKKAADALFNNTLKSLGFGLLVSPIYYAGCAYKSYHFSGSCQLV